MPNLHRNGFLPRSRAASCVGVALLTLAAGARADLASVPLTLAGVAEPNVIVIIDDSGSMDWEMLFPTESGQLHWEFDTDLPVDDDGNFYTTARDRTYSYLFPNGTGLGNRAYAHNDGNGPALAPRPEYAFARSSSLNAQYYDPDVTYRPWPSRGGYTFADAVPNAALSDPTVAASSTLNLTAEVYVTGDNERAFTTSGGSRGADANGYPSDSISEFRAEHAYRYFPATYYVPVTASVALPAWVGGGNCDSPDPLSYRRFVLDWSNLRQAGLQALGVDAIAPGGGCLRKVEIRPGNTFPSGRTYADEIQNFANWFTYHRKRHLALRAGLGTAFDDKTGVQVGAFTINDRTAVTMWDLDTNKNDFFEFLYEVRGGTGVTPNRSALNFAGSQFNRSTNPVITQACQKNFSLLFTDGYANSYTQSGSLIDFGAGNADGDNGVPFADTRSNTIADISMRYYETRLRTALAAGKVPVPAECSFANAPAWLDCNANLHMNTYAVTLGARGTVFGNTHFTVRDAHDNPPSPWPNPNASGADSRPVQVDDLYHAAVNGRGELLNARSTAELSQKLSAALQTILDSVTGSASAVSSNSTRLDADTLIYQARFDSRRWSGELIAFGLESDGDIGSEAWDAGELIPAPGSRRIYSRNTAGEGIRFEWGTDADQLDATQRAAFDRNAAGTADGRGEARVNWLRGVRSAERPSGALRQRDRVLGDIVNSSPWFVGGQNFGYDQLPAGAAGRDTYAAFRLANAESRDKMVYVGANDGMLHAFDAATGVERFAFVPSTFTVDGSAAAPLNVLTEPGYAHRYFVDGTPVAGDVYFGADWHTVLVGTLGAGGRSVFALDVTDPDDIDEDVALWEFTHADLGNVLGRASIARMANGRFAAVFGNGFGSGSAAKLFIVDIEDGSLIRAISTDTDDSPTDNGLSAPIPVDLNGDRVIDAVYAGDYYGNLWKFDVSSADASNWRVAFDSGSGAAPRPPRPLYRACASGDATDPFATGAGGCSLGDRQPITMRPEVGRGPVAGSVMIYFGTGKFIENGDNVVSASTPVQSFYAIRDDNSTTGPANADRVDGRSELVRQQITHELTFDADDEVRVTTRNAVPANRYGWYLDLVSPPTSAPVRRGERAVAQPILREGRIIFTTLIPSGDACDAGGTSWLMELDALSGGRFDNPVFDLDDDGAFTDGDNVDEDGNANTPKVPPSGRRSRVGIIQTPAIISAGAVEYKVTGGSTGGIESITERGNQSKGRNSWRQLWPGG